MNFTDCLVANLNEGYILAHSLKTDHFSFKKGRILSKEDIKQIKNNDLKCLTVAILEENDLHEDDAADTLAKAIDDPNIDVTAAFTGRVNLIAKHNGIITLKQEKLINFNLVNDAIAIATLSNHSKVETGQLIATIKIIPFGVDRSDIEKAKSYLEKAITFQSFKASRVALIQTQLPTLKDSVYDKTKETLNQRLSWSGSHIVEEKRVPHQQGAIETAMRDLSHEADLIILSSASAITDQRDIIPAALQMIGGTVKRYGMPVDPGNLLLLGDYDNCPIIAMPGCARSPKLNGFDWVLDRVLANIPIEDEDFAAMSIGGLLKEIPSRPAPRQRSNGAANTHMAPKIAAILLAAGQSRRMGNENKLLKTFKGKTLISHALDCLIESKITQIITVTGHEHVAVKAHLMPYVDKTLIVQNMNYAAGISTSIQSGLSNLSGDIDAALIYLGDMPLLTPQEVKKLIASFSIEDGREICIPTHNGKWGNPVLISRRFFPGIMKLTGDIGAKPILMENTDFICEVSVNNQAVLVDTDTPEAFNSLEEISS